MTIPHLGHRRTFSMTRVRSSKPCAKATRRHSSSWSSTTIRPLCASLVPTCTARPWPKRSLRRRGWGSSEGLHRFAGRASLKTYLFRILVNCASASRRHEARSVPVSRLPAFEEDESAPAVNPDRFFSAGQRWGGHWAAPPEQWPEESLLAAETWGLVERAMAHLPPLQRAVLTLRDVEG